MANINVSPILEAIQVSKYVTSGESIIQILTDINVTIYPRDTLAIIGSSGSGKSTLLGLLAGLDVPSSGKIFLEQKELTALDEDGRAQARAGTVGFVFQSFHLIRSLTALENIMLPLELAGFEAPRKQAVDFLGKVGLSKRGSHYPSQLSGGEQQRVAIARAFASQPKVLFADEPTGNLDKKTGEKIANLLFECNAQHNTTIILITHDEYMAQHCQRQLKLENGQILL